MKTYEVIQTPEDGKAIRCLRCGLVSFHPMDVREKYCGNCHRFHEEDQPS